MRKGIPVTINFTGGIISPGLLLRVLELAEAAGMTYREYTLELMERGRHTPARTRD